MNIRENIIKILNSEIKPAVGCTEPVAIALCAAACKTAIKCENDDIETITVKLSPNIYKNGMNVGIPNIDEIGLDVAAALGVAKGDTSKKLEILGTITEEDKQLTKTLLNNNKVKIELYDNAPNRVYVECTIKSGNNVAKAIIVDKHDNIVDISLNGKSIYVKENSDTLSNAVSIDEEFFNLNIIDIVEEIEKIDFTNVEKMIDGIKMNMNVAQIGIKGKYGFGIGYGMNSYLEKGAISKDLPNLAFILTAAACDVRMSGSVQAVMSSNGSGNHGLTAILPIAAYNEIMPQSDDKLARAVAISHVVTAYIKHYVGRLAPLCGCSIAAATGSACGLVWLMGGKNEEIQGTIKNILANQAGVVCDGAKAGCAFKLGTAASAGVQAVMLAMKGIRVYGNNGIVMGTAEQSIKNLGELGNKGMTNVDKSIIDIMLAVSTCD